MKSMMFKLPKTLSIVIIGRIDQNLWNIEISSYVEIFLCGILNSKFKFGRFRPEIGRSTSLSNRIHLNVFSHQRGSGLSQIQHLYTRFCKKPWKIGFHSVWHVEYSTDYGPRNFYHQKVHNLSYILHTYDFFHSSHRWKVIIVWNPKFLRFVGFLWIHHVC